MSKADNSITDPRIVALRFQSIQLTKARELRALTKTELAEKILKTPSAISQFESGDAKPDAETITRMALALGVRVGFFARRTRASPVPFESCNFRSLRSVSQYFRRQAIRIGEVTQEVIRVLEEEGIELPTESLSTLKRAPSTLDDIEELANTTRRAWGLGLGPIPRLMTLLESKGVRILPLANACAEVDAFSMWHEGRPYILLAPKATSRIHFDAAHELGHLLMHEDVVPGDPKLESEADHFASAFLLPRDSFSEECPTRWNLQVFRSLKKRWHVSIQALVVRAYKLGHLSSSSYRRAFAEINRAGIRITEPDEWEFEQPKVLHKALTLVRDELPIDRLALELELHEAHLRELLDPFIPK